MIRTRLYLIPVIIKMLLNCRIVLYMDALYLSSNSIMRVYKPQICPIITVSSNIPATENRSNKFGCSLALILGLASIQNLAPLGRINDESIVETGLDAIIDLDVPIFQRRADSFYFRLDAPLYVAQDRPRFVSKRALQAMCLHIIAPIFSETNGCTALGCSGPPCRSLQSSVATPRRGAVPL